MALHIVTVLLLVCSSALATHVTKGSVSCSSEQDSNNDEMSLVQIQKITKFGKTRSRPPPTQREIDKGALVWNAMFEDPLNNNPDLNFIFVVEYSIGYTASHTEVWFCPKVRNGRLNGWSPQNLATLKDLTKPNRRKAKGTFSDYQSVDQSWWAPLSEVKCQILSFGDGMTGARDPDGACSGINDDALTNWVPLSTRDIPSRGRDNAQKYYFGISDHSAQVALENVCTQPSGADWSANSYWMAAPRHNCQEFAMTLTKCDLKLYSSMPAWHVLLQAASCAKYDRAHAVVLANRVAGFGRPWDHSWPVVPGRFRTDPHHYPGKHIKDPAWKPETMQGNIDGETLGKQASENLHFGVHRELRREVRGRGVRKTPSIDEVAEAEARRRIEVRRRIAEARRQNAEAEARRLEQAAEAEEEASEEVPDVPLESG